MKNAQFLLLLILLIGSVAAEPLYFFYGDGCPHCSKEEIFLEEMKETYEIEVLSYEVWYNPENAELMNRLAAEHNTTPRGVPTTFYNGRVWIGFSDAIKEDIANEMRICAEVGCGMPTEAPMNSSQDADNKVVDLPIIGQVDVSEIGLLSFTLILGILDGFNACAMWVLCFLLSLLIYSKSRKHVFMVGGTFIFISGLVYFLFMAAWMNAFIFAGHLRLIQVGISILAIIFGIVNIKDFFALGKGISFTIPESKKPSIIKKMRGLVNPQTGIVLTLLGVAGLAFMVNLVELLCTAGFPAIYTSILAQYDLPGYAYYLYLLLYIIMYMIDDFIIFTVVVSTMTSKRFTEKYGRLSKLISGIVILVLGIMMLINPKILMFG
jgi:glutaredoxin